ncbi:MAG TPA: hypothetical protein PK349_11460 [Candidatus Hydrogenedentes bacterium]|nr:hypothetical protein [Candidatus Hydrogenedentota bacterium]
MSKTITICDDGRCGQCYRCRLRRLQTEFEALRDAVSRMRQAQRAYFQTKAISALREAQAAERKVDKLLKPTAAEQPRLL